MNDQSADRAVRLVALAAAIASIGATLLSLWWMIGSTPLMHGRGAAQHSPTFGLADTQESAGDPSVEIPTASQGRFTKTEFDDFVFGKTKAEIRREFGDPDGVDDASDSWYYNQLGISDPASGTHAVVKIRFLGIDGPRDSVAATSYP